MIAALYIDPKGPYASMPGVDPWDEARDATKYAGPYPVVAHPPCGPWGGLRHFCKYQRADLAEIALGQVQRWGGILEHPSGSLLWRKYNLPYPGEFAWHGLWTMEVDQVRWGHRAQKRTWLLLCGIKPSDVGPLPPMREATHVISTSVRSWEHHHYRPHVTSLERRMTPPLFAKWLVILAGKSATAHRGAGDK